MTRNENPALFSGNFRKILREREHEKRRLEFVKVRKAGGGEREKLRRKIGGFYTRHREVPQFHAPWDDYCD